MGSRIQRSFEFHKDHVRAHADAWQITDASGSNLEIVFQRDVLLPPAPQEYELTSDGRLVPAGDDDTAQRIRTELLCSVRMRPDQVFDLAEDLLRHVQQMRPTSGLEGETPGAD